MSAISCIGQIAITVSDPARALAFYRDVVGLTLLFQAGELSFFDCGGVRLMLTKSESPSVGTSIIYYKVAEIHEASAQIKQLGAKFESDPHLIAKMPDHELWMAFFRDSENNLVGLMSEVR